MFNDLFENLSLDSKTRYFLYIGEIKALYLNEFLREALSGIYGKDAGYIAIVPDVLETYPEENILINPLAVYQTLQGVVPLPEFRICAGLNELQQAAKTLSKRQKS